MLAAARALTKEEVEDYEEAFKNFDKDGNGEIDLKELGIVMRSLGYSPTDKQLRDMLKQADDDGNGVITFNEFVEMMRRCELSTDFEMEIKGAFEFFDKDGDGDITSEELASVMRGLGANLSDQEIALLVKEADKNGDGAISLHEFTTFLYS
ncbi:yellow cameleon 2.60 [Tribonema minus]|uniref:Calmodulin n=1 Tax=Tribonema minus TaxID=303371 RepID=A0A835YVF8_9STRA|nr:yellow cameleon 2.60 [Tribonema minus]